MGTKVQCKSYLPGYYPMRDLNLNSNNGSWSLSYEEKILKSGQYYNYFSSMPMDGSEYDKEALKKTMLKHEVTFRNQVHELHRLYRIQRDLMNELQNKELNKYSALFETSQPDPFSSQIPFGDTQNIWKMPTLPGAKFSCSWPSLLGADNKQSPLNFVKDSRMHTGLSPTKNRVNAKDNELLDSKLKKVTRTFDLQLPANEYIFSEDGEAIQEEKGRELPLAAMHSPNGQCGVEHESDVNLSLGSGGDPSYKVDDWRPNSHLQSSGHTHRVADLNKPIQGMCSEEAEASASVSFLGFMCHRAETQGKQVPSVQNLGIFGRSSDSLQDNQKSEDCSSFSNFLHGENETRHEQLSYCLEAGKCRSKSNSFSPVLCHEQSPTSTKSIQTELKKAHELPALPLADKSKREASFIENATCSIQIPRSPRLNISNHSAPVTPQIPTRFSSCTDDANAASPLVSSWKQPMNRIIHVPVAAQALPCINGSAALNVQTKSSNPSIQSPRHNWDLNSNLSLHPSFGSEVCYQNGFNNGSSSESNVPHVVPLIGFEKLNPDVGDCSAYNPVEGGVPGKTLTGLHFQDVKSANDINLNVCLPNGFREEVDHRSDHVLVGGERKHRDSRMSWLRTRPVCNESRSFGDGAAQMDLGFIEACSGLLSSHDAKIQLLECENKTEKGPPVFLKDFSSTLHDEDGETCKTDQAESPSNKNIGFPALSKSSNFEGQHAFSSSSMPCRIQSEINDVEKSVRVGLLHADIACDLPLHDSEKQIHAENPVTDKGIDSNRTMGSTDREINLNSRVDMLDISFTSTNDSEFSTSVSGAALLDIAVAIDLETPILPDTFEFTPPTPPNPPGGSVAANKQVTSTQPKQCEMEGPKDLLARTAAEAIVAMSSEIRNQSDDAGCHTSPDDLMDPLHWFSEVVFSNTSDLDGKAGSSRGMSDADKEASDDEGIDFFEAMTLKLVETKVEDEYLCNKLQQEHDNQDGDSGIPPLLSRPRRRQTRRRRQRMDFQKDILPGLVSLSRHEVTEDLQLLEGLMRALGCSWQSGLSRKNMVRNGWHCRGRGRRQPRGLAAAARMGKLVSQPPWQPSHSEVERKGISLQGWGKTTRRCHRRQRLPMADAI